jgi:hypothetical protein
MNCWHCERPAHAGCTFCGRAVCRDHVKTLPHLDAVVRAISGGVYALATPDAVHCGVCRPRGKPVRLDELEQQLDGTQ